MPQLISIVAAAEYLMMESLIVAVGKAVSTKSEPLPGSQTGLTHRVAIQRLRAFRDKGLTA